MLLEALLGTVTEAQRSTSLTSVPNSFAAGMVAEELIRVESLVVRRRMRLRVILTHQPVLGQVQTEFGEIGLVVPVVLKWKAPLPREFG
jgi:hypothetical protein